MSENRIDAGGVIVDADSIRARLSAEQQAKVNRIIAEGMRRESELGAYDAEAVLELGRHVI